MPIHVWLPNAMVAPTPVSALLHAVAVVKAGVFSILKVVVYIFGIDFLAVSGHNQWLLLIAGMTVILSSLIAMTKDNLKARLAYSTISQLSYIVLGAALATSLGIIGGSMHRSEEMKEEWSLKDKNCWSLMDVKRIDLCEGGRFWVEDDIETLRKKILEDIENDYIVNETDFG